MANPKSYIVEQRSEFCFAVLMPNPDAGKRGVCYSGQYLTMCTADGKQEADKIAAALNAYDRPEMAAPVASAA